jgi:hypothetical protein
MLTTIFSTTILTLSSPLASFVCLFVNQSSGSGDVAAAIVDPFFFGETSQKTL